MSLYQTLYPNLNFKRAQSPAVKTMNTPPTPAAPRAVSQPKEVIAEPVVEQIHITPPAPEPPVIKVDKPKKKVIIREEKPVETSVPEQIVSVVEAPKVKKVRPNRVKPEPKPETTRLSQLPIKGEQGLQPKYSFDQKKNIYLDRLSRKSVKNAEIEIGKVNEILDSVDRDPVKLKGVETAMKKKLKLINSAKYFAEKAVVAPIVPVEPVPVQEPDSETDYDSDSE